MHMYSSQPLRPGPMTFGTHLHWKRATSASYFFEKPKPKIRMCELSSNLHAIRVAFKTLWKLGILTRGRGASSRLCRTSINHKNAVLAVACKDLYSHIFSRRHTLDSPSVLKM